MKKFVLCIIGISLPIYLLPFILRGDLDRFNPIAEEKNVYAIAKGYGVPDYHHKGRTMYSLKGVDESRNEKEYTVGTSTPNDFIRKTYLKIHVKGKYVYSYDVISEKEIPEKIKDQLEIKEPTRMSWLFITSSTYHWAIALNTLEEREFFQ